MNINDYINLNAAYKKYTPDIIKKGLREGAKAGVWLSTEFKKLTGMGETSKAATQSKKVTEATTPLMRKISEFQSQLDTEKDVELRNKSIKEFVNTVTGSLNNKPLQMWEKTWGRSSERRQEEKDLNQLRQVIHNEINDNMNPQLKTDLQTYLINDAKKTFLDELFDGGYINVKQYNTTDTLEKCINLLDTILDKTEKVPKESLDKFTNIVVPIAIKDNGNDESLRKFLTACDKSEPMKLANPQLSIQYSGNRIR